MSVFSRERTRDCHLTSRGRIFLQKLRGRQLVKKFPEFYATPKLITAFTNARHMSPSSAKFIYYTISSAISFIPILILFYYLCAGLPSSLFPSGFPTKIMYSLLSSPSCALCPVLFVHLHFIARRISGEQCRSYRIYS